MSEYVLLEQEMKDMADTIIKYLPRITVCLEEIAKDRDEYAEDIDLQAFAQGRKSSFDGINSQSDKNEFDRSE